MGLRSEIQNDLAAAFDGDLADAVKTINLIKITNDYSTDTGLDTPTETLYATRGVLSSYIRELFDTGVEPSDKNILILTNELDAIPEIDDYIDYSSTRYKIIKVKDDPADATWELQCRL